MEKNHDKTVPIGGSLVGRALVGGGLLGRSPANEGSRGGNLVSGGWRGAGSADKGQGGRNLAEALDAAATGHVEKDYSPVKPSIDRLAKADPRDVQEVAASQLQLMIACHRIDLTQARRCFFWALVAAGAGLLLFVLAALSGIVGGSAAAAFALVLSGFGMEAVAALLFSLYGRSAAESRDFHVRLETVQRHIIANSICEGLHGDKKEQTRAELARKIANIHTASFLTAPPQSPDGRPPASDR
jgi:hypothetical protein